MDSETNKESGKVAVRRPRPVETPDIQKPKIEIPDVLMTREEAGDITQGQPIFGSAQPVKIVMMMN